VAFLPRDGLGVVVLANSDGITPFLVAFGAIDHLLGLDPVPWSERARQDMGQQQQATAGSPGRSAVGRSAEAPLTHPLDAYVGDYEHPAYGTVSITIDGDGLAARLNELPWRLEHLHYDYFEAASEKLEIRTRVHFAIGEDGEIASFAGLFETGVREIEFKRVPPESMLEPDLLARLVGAYEVMGMIATVALKDAHTLTVALPGQPTFELEPYRGTEYRIKNMPGFSVEFELGESGEATELAFHQPNGVFTATRRR
jgi:hypothetical protein